MRNADVARYFEELADLLEIKGANPFRIRAYRNASRTLDDLSESVSDIIADPDRSLTELEGIGKDLAEKIDTIIVTNSLPQLEALRKEIPPGVVEMLKLPNIGPKKVAVMFRELNVTTLDDLKAAIEQGKVAELKGFGKKTEQTILEGLEQVKSAGTRVYLADAKAQADAILKDLKKLKAVKQGEVAGSCRRRKETVGDLDVLITSDDSATVMDALTEHDLVEKVLARGETKQRVRLHSGLEMDLRVVPEEAFGAALLYFTGSKEHNIVLRRRAQDRDLKLNEYGLFKGEKTVAGQTEADVYEAIDLPWIPPELRENRGEVEMAEQRQLPKLLELDDIKGDLHMHTTASDGQSSIQEMAEAAKALGRKYIAITDHSKRVSMANGLDARRLRAHWKEIDQIRSKVSGIEILCGVECDILEDATLDLDDEVLAEADWVIAVLHYGLKQPRDQIQKRLLNAIACPHIDAIGHLTGRLIGKRTGADIDFEDVFKAAADHGVLMEINASPKRLDLDDIHAAAAKAHGIPIVINTDAHKTVSLEQMQYGVYQARRAGLQKADVANTRTLKQFLKLLK